VLGIRVVGVDEGAADGLPDGEIIGNLAVGI